MVRKGGSALRRQLLGFPGYETLERKAVEAAEKYGKKTWDKIQPYLYENPETKRRFDEAAENVRKTKNEYLASRNASDKADDVKYGYAAKEREALNDINKAKREEKKLREYKLSMANEWGFPYEGNPYRYNIHAINTDDINDMSLKDLYEKHGITIFDPYDRKFINEMSRNGWTSEVSPFDPDVKGTITTPVPEEEQRKRFIEEPKRKSMDRFKKGIEHVWTTSRYLPGIYGAIPNAVEFAKAVDERDLGEMVSNSTAFLPLVGWLRKAKALNDAKKYASSPGIKLLKWNNMDNLANEFGKDKAEKIISYGNWADNSVNVTMNAIEDLSNNNNEMTTLEWLDSKIDRRPKVGDTEKKQFGGRVGIKKKRFDKSEKRFMDLLGEVSSR